MAKMVFITLASKRRKCKKFVNLFSCRNIFLQLHLFVAVDLCGQIEKWICSGRDSKQHGGCSRANNFFEKQPLDASKNAKTYPKIIYARHPPWFLPSASRKFSSTESASHHVTWPTPLVHWFSVAANSFFNLAPPFDSDEPKKLTKNIPTWK